MSRKFIAAAFAFACAFALAAVEVKTAATDTSTTTTSSAAAKERSRRHTDAEYAVAFAYCDAVNLAESQRNTLDLMLDNLVRSNPAMKELRPAMERIFSRYLNFEAVKYDYADIFLDEFTVDELKELTRISRLPVMKKYLSKQQKLMQAGSLIAQKHLAPHQQEIRAEIQAFMLKKAAEKAAAEAEKARKNNAAQPAAR